MEVIIVEDEHIASSRLKRKLVEINSEIEVLTILESIEDSVEYLTKNKHPDVLFLDIHLADGNSFELFNLINVESQVIFTTAYDQYAIEAFRANAIDYLLKPIKTAELEQALSKIRMPENQPIDLKKLLSAYKQESKPRFLTRLGSKVYIIEHTDIAYCYTKDKMSFIVKKDGTRLPTNKTLDQLEDKLEASQFFRANRQVILSIQAIAEMIIYSKSRLKIILEPKTDFDIIISTEKTPLFKKWIEGEME